MGRFTKDTISRFISLLLIYILVVTTLSHETRSHATSFNGGAPSFSTGLDACASTGYTKSNVSVSITSATTTNLVSAVAGQVVYICDWTFTINSSATTASSVKFEYGTTTTTPCDTGTTAVTGAMGTENAAAGAGILIVNGPAAGESFQAPVANAVCLVTAGTTVALHGQVTYVQM